MKISNPLKKSLLMGLSITAIMIVFLSQLLYVNPYASSWDQVDFSLAVTRFDLMAMQPHFPGYPLFILGGKFIHLFVNDPSKALTLFNILFYASTVFPIYKLCRSFLSEGYSWLSAAIIYSSSFCIIMVNQPMSEGAALAAFWWYLWSLLFAIKRTNSTFILIPLAMLSLMLGIRLSYLPFSIGILFLFYLKFKNKTITSVDLIYYCLFGIAFQACWIVALIVSEGSLIGFIKLSLAFTSGHFNDWGGAIETSKISFLERLTKFSWGNIVWTGIAGKSMITAVIFIFFLAASLFHRYKKQEPKPNHPFIQLLYLMFSCYFVWGLLGQNIEKARHVLPLIILLVFIICIHLFSKRVSYLILGLAFILLGHQVWKDVILLKAEGTESPAVYKMNEYISKMDQPVILYTWEETRVLQYLNAPYPHKRLETFDFFTSDSKYFRGRTILLTDKVVEGFLTQGHSLDGKIIKVASFQSNELFDPVYHDITLYKWIGNEAVH
ncbi:hypothetical protein COJ96_13315 [Bacillus sp. AFS073361]|uniref:hypothetical protein n=1 Tax=Bacillus sp. AFS073361 TaxID=2033511 RepID=UPI000BF87404|nr:hypothetical protein [Bacillus sp. AFS073361]PFP28670.1 hypothetical protein COJ96_13315 [Bacillus sp. AFS073361]